MAVEISDFKPMVRNTLRGFFTARLFDGVLEIRDLTLHEKNGSRWVGLPGRPYEHEGQTKYAAVVRFPDKEHYAAFQKAALKALEPFLGETQETANDPLPF